MIIFYHGSDTYRLRAALPSGVKKILDVSHEEERITAEQLLKYPPLFQEEIVLVLRNVLADAETAAAVHDILKRYQPDHRSDITLIVCQEGTPGRTSTASTTLRAYLNEHAQTTEEFIPLTGAALIAWVTDFCAQRECDIQPAARDAIISRTAGDRWALAMELEKVCAYSSAGHIDRKAVDMLVPSHFEHDEWRLVNALSAGNKRLAIVTLWERLAAGTPIPLLVGMLAHATRTLLARPGHTVYNQTTLIRMHRSLAELDRSSKSGITDGEDGLFMTLISL